MAKHSTEVVPSSSPWWRVKCLTCRWDDYATTKHFAKVKGKAHEEEES